MYGKRTVGFFSLASQALRACEARALRAHKTLTPRFTDFFTDFEKKTDRFAVYVSCLLCSYPGGAEQRFLQHKFLSDAYQPESDAENENTYEHRLLI